MLLMSKLNVSDFLLYNPFTSHCQVIPVGCSCSCVTWFDNCDEGGDVGWDNEDGRVSVCSYVKKL